MKPWNFLCAIVVIVALSLPACNVPSQTQGPSLWIDQPLNGVHAPLAPLTIQAHASDADGVAAIRFFTSSTLLEEVPIAGQRLGDASIEWMPPGPGIYAISAEAIDSQGNTGPKAVSQITVGELVGPTHTPGPASTMVLATETPTPAPATSQCPGEGLVAPVLLSPGNGDSVEPDPVLAWSYPDVTCHPQSYRIDIAEDASFSDISLGFGTLDYNETSRAWPLPAGQCYYWRARAYVPDVSGPASPAWQFCIEGEGLSFTLIQNANCRAGPGTVYEAIETLNEGEVVTIEGRNEESNWFWVRKPGSSGHCWVSMITGQVEGDANSAPIVATPAPSTQTQPVASDTVLPEITDYYADPESVQQQGCGEPSTTLVSATVSDAGGVNRVVARIPGYGEIEMTSVGGNMYQAVVGPFSDTGEISILIQAWDNAGNGAQSGLLTITVVCIG